MLFEKDSAFANMQKDIEFFSVCDRPAFRLYGFNTDCITAGYFQDIASEIDIEKANLLGIDIAKRPTGGGIVFHSSHDIAFCSVLPSDMFPKGFMSAYHFVSDIVLDALKQAGIGAKKHTGGLSADDKRLCFSGAQDYEITYGGKKLVGIAQKRTKEKILQQGTICISRPQKEIVSVLRKQYGGNNCYGYTAMLDEIIGKTGTRDAFLSFADRLFRERFENLPSCVL
ncbi:MAG: hypothetical protein WC527_06320 [Candidatus Margulisiibacteriota bacterium]